MEKTLAFSGLPSQLRGLPVVPPHFGHYRVIRLLGEGGMARVYQVEFEDEETRHQYALKTLLHHDVEDRDAHDRFVREIQICIKLHHPNICRLVDWDIDDDGIPFIVMEMLEGELLLDRINRLAPMPVAMMKPLVVQILQGLEAMHALGIVHRDLKPANIFVTTEGLVKVMDFGISRQSGMRSITDTNSTLGTPDFISPEQILDTHHVDHRTDLFNVGLIAYAMLAARLPMDTDSVRETLQQLLKGQLHPISRYRSDLPQALEPWLGRLLAQDRTLRFATAREAIDAIAF